MPLPRHALAVFALLSAFALAPSIVAESPWRSELYPSVGYDPSAANLETDKVLQDFSFAGYRRGEAPIPDVAGPVFDVTAEPYRADASGETDATAAIQTAIDAAGRAGGGVVFLPAGTYRLEIPKNAPHALLIEHSGVVLRGAGRERTFLLGASWEGIRLKNVIRVRGPAEAGYRHRGTQQVPLSTDLLNSTRIIPVADTAPFSVGDTVVIRNDIGDAWIEEHNVPGWLGLGPRLGALAYRRTVLAIDSAAGTLTVDAPTRYALKLRDSARVVRLARPPISEVGLEDFSIGQLEHPGETWAERDFDQEGAPAHDIHGVIFLGVERVRDSWIRRVSSYRPAQNRSTAHLLSGGLALRESTHVTVEDCSLQRPQYGGGGGNGYMYRFSHAGECLMQRSEARFARHGFVFLGIGTSGNVIYDCVDAETGYATGSTGSYRAGGRSSDHHMHPGQANLIDSCTAEDSWFEAVYRPYGSAPKHYLTALHSVFWNTRGTGSIAAPVVRSEQGRYGYVIGTRGPRSRVELPRRSPAATDPVDHVEGEGRGDTLVPQSLFQDQRARRIR